MLCTSSRFTLEKPKEHYMNDVLNTYGLTKRDLGQCGKVKYLLTVTSLGPALISKENNFRITGDRNSRINLVIDNTKITDRYKNFKILMFKEAIKINEANPTLNTGLRASTELQLF